MPTLLDLLSLSELSALRELDLSIISAQSLPALHEFLCGITSAQLSTICLEVKGRNLAELDTSHWGDIDKLLSQSRWRHLCRVNLALSTVGYWNKQDISSRRLPALCAEGILHEGCRDGW